MKCLLHMSVAECAIHFSLESPPAGEMLGRIYYRVIIKYKLHLNL